MLNIKIPGANDLELKYLVCDYSGTLSVDGILVPGVADKMQELSESLDIYVLTSDTHGKAAGQLQGAKCHLTILDGEDHSGQKMEFVEMLGGEHVAAMGNGRNDVAMLQKAALSIGVCLDEGCAVETIQSSDILIKSAPDAFDLLLNPNRLIATLRR